MSCSKVRHLLYPLSKRELIAGKGGKGLEVTSVTYSFEVVLGVIQFIWAGVVPPINQMPRKGPPKYSLILYLLFFFIMHNSRINENYNMVNKAVFKQEETS